jgi:hypothetical protein
MPYLAMARQWSAKQSTEGAGEQPARLRKTTWETMMTVMHKLLGA